MKQPSKGHNLPMMFLILALFVFIIVAAYYNVKREGWTCANCTANWNSPQQTMEVYGNTIASLKVTNTGGTGTGGAPNYVINSDQSFNNVNYGGQTCSAACSSISGCAGFVLDTSSNICNFKNSLSGAQSSSLLTKWLYSFTPSCNVTGG